VAKTCKCKILFCGDSGGEEELLISAYDRRGINFIALGGTN